MTDLGKTRALLERLRDHGPMTIIDARAYVDVAQIYSLIERGVLIKESMLNPRAGQGRGRAASTRLLGVRLPTPEEREAAGRRNQQQPPTPTEERDDTETDMASEAVRLSKERNLTGIARKVLESTPSDTDATKEEVARVLARAGATVDLRVVHGCLKSLAAGGLVRERDGRYRRKLKPATAIAQAFESVGVKPATTQVDEALARAERLGAPLPAVEAPAPSWRCPNCDKIADPGEHVCGEESPPRTQPQPKPELPAPPVVVTAAASDLPDPLERVSNLAARMRALAGEVTRAADEAEEIALEFAAHLENVKRDTQQLRKLQELLRTINLGG